MAGGAALAATVVRGFHLRHERRPTRGLLMAADAERYDIRPRRFRIAAAGDMLAERAVAALTADVDMARLLFDAQRHDVAVAGLARGPIGKVKRPLARLDHRGSPVVADVAERLRNEKRAREQKAECGRTDKRRKP